MKLRTKPSVNKLTSPLTGRFNLGFTLVELLVVISIIAVLTAVLTTNFMGMRERARDAQKIQDLNSLKDGLRMYYNDKQSYPSDGGNACSGCLNTDEIKVYIPSIASIGYTYDQINNGDGFLLWSGLEAGAGTDDTDSQIKCGLGTTQPNVFMVCAK